MTQQAGGPVGSARKTQNIQWDLPFEKKAFSDKKWCRAFSLGLTVSKILQRDS